MALHGQAAEEQREVGGSRVSATLHIDAKKIPSAPALDLTQSEACLPMMALANRQAWSMSKPAGLEDLTSKEQGRINNRAAPLGLQG